MTPGWGRTKCSRRRFPPPLCVPMPRPCLDSLQIPTLQPCALHQTPRPEFVPCCVQPSCGIKLRTCHCADKNYCTSETCTDAESCIQYVLSPEGFKGGKDEDSVCNGPCRQQEASERNYVENYETIEPACNEASCEKLENCGIGAISNDEEIVPPVTYTPSVTNQSSLSRTPPIVPSRQVPFNNDSAQKNNQINDSSLSNLDSTGRGMNQKAINFDEVNKLSNINRGMQINMQNEIVSGRSRDAESSVAPEVCCSGNEVPNTSSLSGSSQSKLYNEDKINDPVQNIKSTFDAAIEKHDTNAQPYNLSSKISKSHLNNHVSNVEDNGAYFKDNLISLTDESNNNPNEPALNSCCDHSYDFPASFKPEFQVKLSDTKNGEFVNDSQRINKTIQQNVKLFSEQYENHAKIDYVNGTPMQSAPQMSPGTDIESQHIRNNTENIWPKDNVFPNYIPSSTKTPSNVNANTSNELAKISLSSNNSTNERRLFNEGNNQFMSSAPNECCVNETPHGHLGSSESNSQKPPQYMSPLPSTNIQHIKPFFTKSLLNNNTSQVRFHDNNHINNATYPSPENQNLRINAPPRSSEMRINNNSSKKNNHKIQPTNSATSDQNDVICENYKQGCCTHGASETANKREVPSYKPAARLDCVCPHELESWTEPKNKQKNARKFASYDLNGIRCQKKPACHIEDGTTSCASTTCIVNQNLGCSCRYPPAFKQFSCTGNISGICNCSDEN